MLVSEYQKRTADTAIYGLSINDAFAHNEGVGQYLRVAYVSGGICGEAGEIAEHVKKALRDDSMYFTPERVIKIQKEIGDLCWYVSQMCTELGLDLNLVMARNLEKLLDRKIRGKLQGSGDDR